MMDQPKIERMLRLMRLLSGSVNFTVEEIAEKMDTSYRSVYRMLKMPKSAKDLENLVYFSEEEAKVVAGLIQGLDQSNGMKANLYKKLSAIYDMTGIDRYTDNKKIAFHIQNLEEAMSERRRVVLKDYVSSNSGQHDVVVEPYDFTGEYIDVWAYDVEKKSNRMYKIARIGSVEILPDDWQCEAEHRKPEMDVFRMNGDDKTHVKIELNRRAKNLLVEEFPLAEFKLSQIDAERWMLETDVNRLEGVGRFVIGLAADVKIIDSPALSAYVHAYAKHVAEL